MFNHSDVATIIAAFVMGIPAVGAAAISWTTSRRVKTNHGLTIGAHVEKIGADLAEYKVEQAHDRALDRATIEGYVAADAMAHAEMRGSVAGLAAQVQALSPKDGTS